jgi:hypothetical protein
MKASATYVCPLKGLIRFEAPDTNHLGNAARVAKGLGLDKLYIPVLENSLLVNPRSKVAFLDQLVGALDETVDAGLTAWIIAPCQRLLGVVWPAPYLVTPTGDPGGFPIFLEGRIRRLKPYEWWTDLSIVEKRIHWLRDLLSAVNGHPAISGWVVLNRELEWARPDVLAAEFVLKSITQEVRERNEGISIYLGIGSQEFCHPEVVRGLAGEVEGFLVSGLEERLQDLEGPANPEKEVLVAAFLSAFARWLFEKEVEIEMGWGFREKLENEGTWFEAGKRLASGGLSGVDWLSLCDPLSSVKEEPPWVLHEGLAQASLLNGTLNPKDGMAEWLHEIRSVHSLPVEKSVEFIDVSPEEYLAAPEKHLSRLWMRFQEGH